MIDPKNHNTFINDWYERCATVAVGHYKTADLLTRRNRLLSGWSAALSAIVGTAVFVTIQAQPDFWIRLVTGFVSLVAAVLATLATSLQYQDRAERHRVAGAKYNSVGREIEQIMGNIEIDISAIEKIRERLDNLATDMPHIPKNVHKEIAKYENIGKWAHHMQ